MIRYELRRYEYNLYRKILRLRRTMTRTRLDHGGNRQVTHDLEDRDEEATRADIRLSCTMIFQLQIRNMLRIALASSTSITSGLSDRDTRLIVFEINRYLQQDSGSQLTYISTRQIGILRITSYSAIIMTITRCLMLCLLPTLRALLSRRLQERQRYLLDSFRRFFLIIDRTETRSTRDMDDASSSQMTRFNDHLTYLLRILTDLTLSDLGTCLIRLLGRRLTILNISSDLRQYARRLRIMLIRSTITMRFGTTIRHYLSTRQRRSTIEALLLCRFLCRMELGKGRVCLINGTFEYLRYYSIQISRRYLCTLFTRDLGHLQAEMIRLTHFTGLRNAQARRWRFLCVFIFRLF